MYLIIKGYLDFIFAFFLILFFSPVLLLIVLILKLFTSGNIFFVHERIGKFGHKFNLYKFRTMKHNRVQILEQYLKLYPDKKIEWDKNHKFKNDPRITKIGYYLREFSLDEIPQLFNILKGEMSFIGPRPIVDKEIKKYGESYLSYKTVKPGLSGLWQVSGRNNVSYSKRVELDRYYIKKISFLLDIKILFKTIPAILSRKGAY